MTPAPEVNHVHHAEIIRIIDGDTFVARVELDFRVKVDITVRVRGLSTPEMNTPEGVQAREGLAIFAGMHGNKCVLRSYKDKMSFARWVCDVWIGGRHMVDDPSKKMKSIGEEVHLPACKYCGAAAVHLLHCMKCSACQVEPCDIHG